ncbi:MAG: DUF6874 family protein [Burkholderiales bacterium]
MIDWSKVSKYEFEIIHKIVLRGEELATRLNVPAPDRSTVTMDLAAAHIACSLQLSELLIAPDADFAHDFFGIRKHIDRRTGALTDCFLPRFAMQG